MSTFIVSPETMTRVLAGFWFSTTIPEDLIDKGLKLYDLNARAVATRYPDAPWPNTPMVIDLPEIGSISQISAYKAVQCLLYQCAELTPWPLLNELETVGHRLAHQIVVGLPDYADAPWD